MAAPFVSTTARKIWPLSGFRRVTSSPDLPELSATASRVMCVEPARTLTKTFSPLRTVQGTSSCDRDMGVSLLIKLRDFRPTTWSIVVADRLPKGDSRTSSKRTLSGWIGRPAAKSIEATTALCSTHRTAFTQIEELPPSYANRPGQMTGSSGLAGARGAMDSIFSWMVPGGIC